jgi:hypothetical protein
MLKLFLSERVKVETLQATTPNFVSADTLQQPAHLQISYGDWSKFSEPDRQLMTMLVAALDVCKQLLDIAQM